VGRWIKVVLGNFAIFSLISDAEKLVMVASKGRDCTPNNTLKAKEIQLLAYNL
jgi:hypothetical protein